MAGPERRPRVGHEDGEPGGGGAGVPGLSREVGELVPGGQGAGVAGAQPAFAPPDDAREVGGGPARAARVADGEGQRQFGGGHPGAQGPGVGQHRVAQPPFLMGGEPQVVRVLGPCPGQQGPPQVVRNGTRPGGCQQVAAGGVAAGAAAGQQGPGGAVRPAGPLQRLGEGLRAQGVAAACGQVGPVQGPQPIHVDRTAQPGPVAVQRGGHHRGPARPGARRPAFLPAGRQSGRPRQDLGDPEALPGAQGRRDPRIVAPGLGAAPLGGCPAAVEADDDRAAQQLPLVPPGVPVGADEAARLAGPVALVLLGAHRGDHHRAAQGVQPGGGEAVRAEVFRQVVQPQHGPAAPGGEPYGLGQRGAGQRADEGVAGVERTHRLVGEAGQARSGFAHDEDEPGSGQGLVQQGSDVALDVGGGCAAGPGGLPIGRLGPGPHAHARNAPGGGAQEGPGGARGRFRGPRPGGGPAGHRPHGCGQGRGEAAPPATGSP